YSDNEREQNFQDDKKENLNAFSSSDTWVGSSKDLELLFLTVLERREENIIPVLYLTEKSEFL
ncbi:15770_t:CDS:2, partial [Gigaspora rosea]